MNLGGILKGRKSGVTKVDITLRVMKNHHEEHDATIGHSGSGFPRVSGANGRASRPIKNTAHIVTPA